MNTHTYRDIHTHTGATLKDPGRDKKQREKRASGEREREKKGEPRESDKTVQRVHGDSRPLGTREVEKRIQVLSNVHISHVSFFPFSHADCKPSFLQTDSHCSLVSFSVSLSWGRRMGKWKKDCGCLLRMGGSPVGNCKGGGINWGVGGH